MIVPRQIKRFEEIIGTKSVWTDPLVNKPSLEDFEQGRVAVDETLIRKILDDILKKSQFCVIVGPHDSGKTWLCYAIGFELKRRGEHFRFIEVDEDLEADSIWNCIKDKGRLDWISYWIIEDCQNNRLEIEDLIQEIVQSGRRNVKFILTLRKAGKLGPEDGIFYRLSRKGLYEVQLGGEDRRAISHVEAIIRSFIKIRNVEKYVKITDDEIKSVAKKWGTNLHGVSLRLKLGWKFDRGMKLTEVEDEYLYDSLWDPHGKVKLELPKRQDVLLAISALCQFEPLFVSSLFLHSIHSNTVIELEREGIIERVKWRGKDFFRIREGDAEWYLKTLSHKIGPQFVESEIKKIFKEYIKSKPPNWMYVFYDLYLRKEDRDDVKEILTSLLYDEEVRAVIEDLERESSLLDAFPFLESISWIDPQQEYVRNFWSNYIQYRGMNAVKHEISNIKASTKTLYRLYKLTPIYELKIEIIFNLINRFKSSNARKINEELASLHKDWKLDFEYFFGNFSTQDWVNVINRSTLKSIRTLFGNFIEHRKLAHTPFMAKFAESLIDDRVDWNLLIRSGDASLYRLNGLIQFVEKVAPEYAKKLIERLSQLDLNDLFNREIDPKAEEKGKTKAKVINDLHAQICKLNIAENWNKIINKIRDDTWRNVFYSSDVEQNFWLLWNIYRHDPDRARRLAEIHGRFLKESILKVRPPLLKTLTFLGILHLCGINIKKIKVGKISFEKVKQILDELKHKERPPCTQIILVLITLKVKLPSKHFQTFKEVLKDPRVMNCIYYNTDLQVRGVLKRLVQQL